MSEHYTYIHRKADTGDVFYVGKGKGQRAWTKSRRNRHWQNIVTKHGFVTEVVARWKTSKEALDHEVFLIWCFRDMGIRLCNMTKGGDGLCEPVQEVREKISASLKGRPGKPMSEATKKHFSETRRGVGNPMFGKHLSESAKKKGIATRQASGYKPSPETGKKISKALLNGYHPMRGKTGALHHNSRPVLCVDTGMVFSSVADAVRFLHGLGYQKARDWNICAACSGKRKSAYGARWKYHNDEQGIA